MSGWDPSVRVLYTQICNQQGYSCRVGHLDPPCPAIKGAPIEQASWTLFDLLRISWTQIFNLQGYSFRVGLKDPPRTAIKGAHVEQVSWTLFDLLCRVDGGNTQLGSAWAVQRALLPPTAGSLLGICKQHAQKTLSLARHGQGTPIGDLQAACP